MTVHFHNYIYTLKGPHWNCQNERIRHAKVFDFSPPDKLLRGTGSGDSDVGLILISSIFLFALIRKRVKYLIRVIQHWDSVLHDPLLIISKLPIVF